ncbi:MAG: hemolysin [Gammaproteobacteria bacterium]|nr:MAG: hemolysin [Gammaproteobacteria bacterium]
MEAIQSQLQLDRKNRFASARAERLLLPHLPVEFSDLDSSDRAEVEHYIAQCFYTNYQAKVTHFLPYIISSRTDDKLTAAVGFQPATNDQPLFLEQYLEKAIELKLSDLTSRTIDRNRIIEIGNLTSSRRGTSQILFILNVAISHQAGFEWGVFTATKQVLTLLNKLNLNTIEVAEANPDSLSDNGDSWGNYYASRPKIVAGNLADAMTLLELHPVTSFMLKNYRNTIIEMASLIKTKSQ